MTQNLVSLALSGQMDQLDAAWSSSAQSPGEVHHYCQAIEILCGKDMAVKASHMALTMVEALAGKGRGKDSVALAMTVVRVGASNEGLFKRLFGLLESEHGGQDWYPVIKGLADLREGNLTREVFESFENLRRYTKGHVVYHRSGWGEGVVEEFKVDKREIVVRFASGKRSELPLQSAIDSLQPLADDDLRTMKLLKKSELEFMAENDPAALIRKAAKSMRGRVSSAELKDALSPAIVPTSKWNAFWKKARSAAALDPYLQVEGPTTRPVFLLRKRPLSFGEEARAAIRHADDLGGEIEIMRDYLGRCSDDIGRATVLDLVQERVQAAVEKQVTKATHAHILDGILMLEENGRKVALPAAQELKAMLLDEQGRFTPEALDKLATQASREHAVTLLKDALGPTWAEMCISALQRVPTSVLESVIQMLANDGHAARLLGVWSETVPFPRRFPHHTFLLGKLYAEGGFRDVPGAPEPIAAARVLLHLARTLASERKGSVEKGRLMTRMITLLAGKKSFLAKVLESIDKENLADFLGIAERGGEDFPQEITDLILRAVANKYPEITAKEEKQFWELDRIYVTRQGLARQKETYRLLVEEKIPENAKQIGAAAALGDLSENSEWEAAHEEQRNLTSRAMEMDQLLKKARLIEDAEIPDGIVAPGTRFVLKPVSGNGEGRRYSLLGPWDTVSEDIINYLAPMGKALLGLSEGDIATLETAEGPEEMRVENIEKVF